MIFSAYTESYIVQIWQEIFVRFLKPVKTEPATPVVSAKQCRQSIAAVRRVIESLPLGARIRHHAEFDENSVLEGLVLGHGFDGHFVFLKNQVVFTDAEAAAEIQVNTSGQPGTGVSYRSIESFQLLIPSDTGEERKLDYDSRASIGRNGPFSKGAYLTVISLGNGAENLRMACTVEKRMVLEEGPHRGLQVAVLNVQLDTIESYEPRAQPRVETRTPVTICYDDSDTVMPAFILDVSEFFLRVALDPEDRKWPVLPDKSFASIALKPWPNKPMLKLKCHFIRDAGGERVFEIDQQLKQGKYVAFEMLDAIELKIALMT